VNQTSSGRQPASRAATTLAFLVAGIWLVLTLGLFFHHSTEPTILGRFSAHYALGLTLFAACLPAVFLGTRGLLTPTIRSLPNGRTLRITPASKVGLLAASVCTTLGLAQLLPIGSRWTGIRYRTHPFLQVVPLPDAAAGVNSRGFRGLEPVVSGTAGLLRVVLLGGSGTFGPDLRFEQSYGELLRQQLQTRRPNRVVDVQCVAVSGYSSVHSLIRFATDAIDLKPDLILVMDGANDLFANAESPAAFRSDYGHQRGLASLAVRRLRDRTGLVDAAGYFARNVLFSDIRRPDSRPIDGVVPDPRPFVRNLRSIAVLARSQGQRIVLCTQPHRYRLDLPPADRRRGDLALRNFWNGIPLPGFVWFSRYMPVFNQNVRDLAAREGLPLLDFEKEVPPDSELWLNEIHVSASGARLEASLAADFLLREGLVP
jgi:lysophospholipase L1-like esterase